MKIIIPLLLICLLGACKSEPSPTPGTNSPEFQNWSNSLASELKWPSNIHITGFTGPDITPSPACLAVHYNGSVFVGVDQMGSLGKDPGAGRIVKLVDDNNDGVVDYHTTYAMVDNPRGLLPLGDQLFVLHTTFSSSTGRASGMDLVVFQDVDKDGVSDGPPRPLIQHISSPKFLQDRGTDHSTNGIQMGIDGWIYIAVGDFGFHGAIDRSGNEMTQLGGGIVRVRPDGTEMEVYTHGLRNIYDVAIDPYMNIFTRGNTNDGGGWNIRFIHQIQSGEYGYPVLFKHFTDEIIPALVDVGGGSGTGALFMQDPNWPEEFNNVPMMADWGRSHLYIHRVHEDGPTFTQQVEDFLALPQITDLDVDATGRMYLSAWDGAGYTGDSTRGYVVRAIPEGWTHKPAPDLESSSMAELSELLKSESAKVRLNAQQAMLHLDKIVAAERAWQIATDVSLPLYARVAGIFTYAQAREEKGIDQLLELAGDASVQEFALRAVTDRSKIARQVPIEKFVAALADSSPRVRLAAMIGLGRIGDPAAAPALLHTEVPSSAIPPEDSVEGPHATPNAEIVLPHIAVRSLVQMGALDECVNAIGTSHSDLALWALRYMHDVDAVDGLIKAFDETSNKVLKDDILTTLSRLYRKEAPYDGSWWWSTRPDTRGPYYKPIVWEGSGKIETILTREWEQASEARQTFFRDLNIRHRMGIAKFGEETEVPDAAVEADIDLEEIKNREGQIGRSSIEDVMLAMGELEGDVEEGKALFVEQGCVACHSLTAEEPMKGPFMGQIGSIMNRNQIAESILKPNASISQGFASVFVTTKDGSSYAGFVTGETSDQIVMRDITGKESTIMVSDIKSRDELDTSMMPAGLANALSYEQFASLITFLEGQK